MRTSPLKTLVTYLLFIIISITYICMQFQVTNATDYAFTTYEQDGLKIDNVHLMEDDEGMKVDFGNMTLSPNVQGGKALLDISYFIYDKDNVRLGMGNKYTALDGSVITNNKYSDVMELDCDYKPTKAEISSCSILPWKSEYENGNILEYSSQDSFRQLAPSAEKSEGGILAYILYAVILVLVAIIVMAVLKSIANKKRNISPLENNTYLRICKALLKAACKILIALVPVLIITCLWQFLCGDSIKMRDTAKSEITQYYDKENPGYSIPKTNYDDGTVSIDEVFIETFQNKPRVRLINIKKKDYEEVYMDIRYSVYGINDEPLGEGYIITRNYGGNSLYLTTDTIPADYLPTRVELTSVTTYPTSENMDMEEKYVSSVDEKSDPRLYVAKTTFQSFSGRFEIVFIVFAVILVLRVLGKKSE